MFLTKISTNATKESQPKFCLLIYSMGRCIWPDLKFGKIHHKYGSREVPPSMGTKSAEMGFL